MKNLLTQKMIIIYLVAGFLAYAMLIRNTDFFKSFFDLFSEQVNKPAEELKIEPVPPAQA